MTEKTLFATCDEESYVLGPMRGYGYNPLSVGDCLDDDKFEAVRKLGWAGCVAG